MRGKLHLRADEVASFQRAFFDQLYFPSIGLGFCGLPLGSFQRAFFQVALFQKIHFPLFGLLFVRRLLGSFQQALLLRPPGEYR